MTQNIHLWNNCNACGASPILGLRYECQTCPLGPDSDFCQVCYDRIQTGALAHPSPDNPHTAGIRGPHNFRVFHGSPQADTDKWLDTPMASAQAPQIPDHFVLRPEFSSGYESTFAGYSFVVSHPQSGQPILLTALHVMDEMLRKKGIDATPDNEGYTGNELPQHITGVNLYNVFAANWMISMVGSASRMLVLPGSRIKDEEPRSDRDIAAFRFDNADAFRPGKIADHVPQPGEAVWLVATHGRGDTRRTFKAVVVAVTDQSFIFRFEDQEKGPQYSSGAPIVNQAGEVVAINVGGGKYKGQRFGHGNHSDNIRKHLQSS